jgi:peptidoglycan/LPS O-acetylase OafA/YrhL
MLTYQKKNILHIAGNNLSDTNLKAPIKNLVSIDVARAIAALGVFFYHLHAGALLSQYTGIKTLANTDNFGATYAVPLFFLISGYCIHLANLKYLKNNEPLPLYTYYKRRLLRIYPAYFVAIFFSIGVNMVTHYNTAINATDFFVHLLMLHGFSTIYFNSINIVLWTIAIELAFYIIYPLFYYLRLRFTINHAMVCAFIVSAISITFFSLSPVITTTERYFFLNLWFSWCCGAYLADKKEFDPDNLKKPVYKLLYLLIVVAFITLQFYYNPHLIVLNYQVNILIWTAPLILLLNKESWLLQHRSWFLKLLIAIGLSSYSLYLFHEPLIFIKNFLAHKFLPHKLQQAGVIIGALIIPGLTWLSYLFFEKPFISKKRKLTVDR